MKWFRVTRQNPCAICQHVDWCTYSAIGSACMRIASDTPMHNGAWLHKIGAAAQPKPEPPRPAPAKINCTKLMAEFRNSTKPEQFCGFASELGVTCDSLHALGCAWATPHRAFAFPMMDGYGNTVGIRLRNRDGHKWAVTGSHQGLFIPRTCPNATAYITEGPTDTAAAVSMGLFAIGRPSCQGANDHLRTALKKRDVRQVIIVADNDGPGLLGAERLASELKLPVKVVALPAKDIREFLRLGGTRCVLETLTQDLIVRMR